MLNDFLKIRLGPEERSVVREAIKAHPGWKKYREEQGVDLSHFTVVERICDCCNYLGIDIKRLVKNKLPEKPPAEEQISLPPPLAKPVKRSRHDRVARRIREAMLELDPDELARFLIFIHDVYKELTHDD